MVIPDHRIELAAVAAAVANRAVVRDAMAIEFHQHIALSELTPGARPVLHGRHQHATIARLHAEVLAQRRVLERLGS